jgi:hypothetical protein
MRAGSGVSEAGPSTSMGRARPPFARRALVAIEIARLARLGFARAALGAAIAVALAFVGAVLVARGDGTSGGSFASILRACARASAWLVGAPLGLALARGRAAADRAEGIEALAAARGASRGALGAARRASGLLLGARLVAAPVLLVGLVAALGSRSARGALANGSAAIAAILFAAVAGFTIATAAHLAAAIGPRRGRSVLALIVIGPWLAADLAGHPAWSLPGALDALLSLWMGIATGGAP